ncbi:hypothetical protein [Amycolatopsis magusensis]|uniref:Metallo-peptidase family M12B Reprolysin-like n=1 Tax=Amycolatopsis magusensis TaxID=882444 RepID=A0ABS4PPS7_9PSEU|nr:hypothetical protein [Amycolatopsis magusensis]MBP2181437.1 hypothetical protein [Amycolatopsis magusensis]
MLETSDPTVGGAETTTLDRPAPAETTPEVVADEDPVLPTAPPRPNPPAVAGQRTVHGRYRGTNGSWLLTLRVDVDGNRPTRRISGDFFTVSGSTTAYFGSFVVPSPMVTTTAAQVLAEGAGTFTWAAGAPKIRLAVKRAEGAESPQPATVEFLTGSGSVGAIFSCAFESGFFRTVSYEQDSVAGAVPFLAYDTGSLPRPAGSPARVLTVPGAFAEAGVELLTTGATNVIPVIGAGANAAWSDAELHAAMVNHFSAFSEAPRWQVWMLVATAHEGGARGIMFDYGDAFQRQGAAVFHDAIGGTDAATQRSQLRTYVHELGHAFNLLHSWQKNLGVPPGPLGPNGGLGDLSWMNYDWKYQQAAGGPGGAAAYWAAFPFQFTDNELVHLRHGFHRDVIMGANAFGTGAADIDPNLFDRPVVDNSGLALELRSPKPGFAYGEPVVVELKLSGTELRGRTTHGYLHPNDDLVSIAVQQPSGRTTLYRPLLRHCVDEARSVRVGVETPALYESAYIGFGADGFLFEAPGTYRLRATYIAGDGSRVLSPVLRIRVRPPVSREDEAAAELLLGEEQGQLLALLGSDASQLGKGVSAIDTLLDDFPAHPLAVYGRLVKGVNQQRDFKELTADKVLHLREANGTEAAALLGQVAEASLADEEGVDNLTLNLAMRTQAKAEAKAGHPEQARDVLRQLVRTFESKSLNPSVLAGIREQAKETLEEIEAED